MNSTQRAELNEAMVRLADGDRGAMGIVYRALRPAVFSFCRRMTGDEAAAEDVTQRSLIKLFREASRFDRNGDALSWALTLAYWECRSEIRHRSRRPDISISSGQPPKTDPWTRVELREALELALASLPDEDRKVVQEAVLGRTLSSTQRKRKQRAIARMRAWWQKEMTNE